jgi:hypothetical protein
MSKFIGKMIDESSEKMCELQVIFEPGVAAIAGAVRRVPDIDDMFEMLTYSAPADVPPQVAQQLPKDQLIATSMYFQGDAVQRVMEEKTEDKRIYTPGDPGLSVPR